MLMAIMLMIEKQQLKYQTQNCMFQLSLYQLKINVNLTKQLNGEFKRSVCWNEYKSKIATKHLDIDNITRFPLDTSFQRVNRLFVVAFHNTTQNVAGNPINNAANRVQRDSHRKYFLPRVEITNYNVLIDGRNFYDQPINDQIRKYDN